jgi:hypothetical protein
MQLLGAVQYSQISFGGWGLQVTITLIGVHWSVCSVFACSVLALLALTQINQF